MGTNERIAQIIAEYRECQADIAKTKLLHKPQMDAIMAELTELLPELKDETGEFYSDDEGRAYIQQNAPKVSYPKDLVEKHVPEEYLVLARKKGVTKGGVRLAKHKKKRAAKSAE